MTTSRVLIKEVKRCHSVGDRSGKHLAAHYATSGAYADSCTIELHRYAGQTEATKDLDDLIGFYTRGSASSTLW
jgi:hypothetical protein